ncbi:hypothetical protein [Vitreoscilla massiliensis]|nr:hypothetical protein [Vitreoscilla massiliensis]
MFEHETAVEVEDVLTLERCAAGAQATEQHTAYIKVETHLNM